MRDQGQIILGSLVLLIGLALLAGQFFDVNVWAICWPLGLILLGVWLAFRPRMVLPGTSINIKPLGDVKRYGAWQVAGEEIWMFAGDVVLDLVHAGLPPGETEIRIFGFIGDINLILPQDFAFSISASGFVIDSKIFGSKRDSFLSPIEYTTPGYQIAERRLRLITTFFILDLDVEQVQVPVQ